ncbi:hypothetical protein MT349_02515 [Rathayibacter caricis]|uniref:hypothetical protein n=1 Tax=Rathayibacter caricis TaxID=110936 RepID=UPI001FB39164|nr:hypothetical protein [Rathayibacter caricis]MCJ1694643.1 hypothetical protein [Rathayibacter caricis]
MLGRHRFPFTECRLVETLYAGSTTFAYDTGHPEILQIVMSRVDSPVTHGQPEFEDPASFFERNPAPDTNTAGMPSTYTDYGGELRWGRPLDLDYDRASLPRRYAPLR